MARNSPQHCQSYAAGYHLFLPLLTISPLLSYHLSIRSGQLVPLYKRKTVGIGQYHYCVTGTSVRETLVLVTS